MFISGIDATDMSLGYHGFWLTCATRHLLELGVSLNTTQHHHPLISMIPDQLQVCNGKYSRSRKQRNNDLRLVDGMYI
jgi:hypothetical protein